MECALAIGDNGNAAFCARLTFGQHKKDFVFYEPHGNIPLLEIKGIADVLDKIKKPQKIALSLYPSKHLQRLILERFPAWGECSTLENVPLGQFQGAVEKLFQENRRHQIEWNWERSPTAASLAEEAMRDTGMIIDHLARG